MKVAIVGVGNLGRVIAQRLLEHSISPDDIVLISRSLESAHEFGAVVGVRCSTDPSRISRLHDEDLLILCVKPQDAHEACGAVRALLSQETVVLSVMAGVSCATLRDLLSHQKVARAMPNLGAQVNQSATTYFVPEDFHEWQGAMVTRIIDSCGRGWRVDREGLIDVATAVAGTGPAYLCWLAEQVEAVAAENGIPPRDAHEMVLQTFKGAVSYLERYQSSFEELRRRVTSPNGTTAAALTVLQEARAGEIVQDAVRAALARAIDLGQSSSRIDKDN